MSQTVKEIPNFLKPENVPNLTKPHEEEKHEAKLVEIVNGLDVRDAVIICNSLAHKYPGIMGAALGDAANEFLEKMDKINGILGGMVDGQ